MTSIAQLTQEVRDLTMKLEERLAKMALDRRRRRLRSLPMSVVAAKRIALGYQMGSLGQPGKLPGFAWGISAKECARGSELAKVPGSVCEGCYARKNFYATWKPVQIAHRRRLEGITHPLWTDAMVTLILRYTEPSEPYFRWLDSGDIQSVEHLSKIVDVCRRTPWVSHWLPTHEHQMVVDFLEGHPRKLPENLCLRLSADMVDQAPNLPAELDQLPTSTVHSGHGNHRVVQVSDQRKDSIECKAYTVASRKGAAGTCRSCRACWDPRVRNISYPIH